MARKSQQNRDFPVVGIGASAGGLAAFQAFFSALPPEPDCGLAFVLIQHLASDHKSLLAELIRRHTHLDVVEITDGMVVRPNCIYIIPPNRDLTMQEGALRLLEPAGPGRPHHPIDSFFRSLARDRQERAIAIVLSGTGTDGTQGIREIKGAGGTVLAQTPESSEFDAMPRHAIGTGLVDHVLAPAEMPARLLAFASQAFRPTGPPTGLQDDLQQVFTLLQARTGHDFSGYKQNTVLRRLERRMAVHQIERLDEYVGHARTHPAELEALFRELLIGVTSFFRDPDAFKALEEKALPALLEERPADATLRVWVPGCSTGEEAYSLAILLQEQCLSAGRPVRAQVFATDIDRLAIEQARCGVYPAGIAADLSRQRLERYFSLEPDGQYRVNKAIRDLLIFSEQDLLKDPPFSRLDLISCRNLLIYLSADLQRRLIPLFHYALSPDGYLLLGTSESVGDHNALFATVDRKEKLYRRKPAARWTAPPFGRINVSRAPELARPLPTAPRQPLRELTERALLQLLDPVAALVARNGDILYLHGRTGKFLEPAPGESSLNILKMARAGLGRGLTTCLRKAATGQQPVVSPVLRVKSNGSHTRVQLTVRPVTAAPDSPEPSLFLVLLKEIPDPPPEADELTTQPEPELRTQVSTLEQELQAREEYLRTMVEELETSNEELKSSNEEMQAVQEELQSTNEELETSQEELQSVNEELATVNAELQAKVGDLTRANNDLNNLLAGTGVGTVFVDEQLRIQRFTPAATRLINLIPADLGRPVSHLVSNLVGYDALAADIGRVLDSLVPVETEVQTRAGAWYLLRIQPYRTLENVVEGAVITFFDITELKLAQALANEVSNLGFLASVVRDAQDAVTVQDLRGKVLAWNRGATRIYGWTENEALQLSLDQMVPPGVDAPALLLQLCQAPPLEPFRWRRLTRSGATVEVGLTATALVKQSGEVYAIALTEREVRP